MIIYDIEKKYGLEKAIASSSIASFNGENLKSEEVKKIKNLPEHMKNMLGSPPESPDLEYSYGIMVTSNWNRNDDVFSPDEMWKARYTPRGKLVNIGHLAGENTDNKTIGFISQSMAVDENYEYIYSSTNDIPKTFHICVENTLWKSYWPQTVAQLHSDIAKAKKFLSMECSFTDFGYAIKAEDSDDISLMPRNEITSSLTRFLQSYGGTGMVTIGGKNYRIGRWIKNILFTGVAYVDVPANPSSIVFAKDMGFNNNEKTLSILMNNVLSENGVFNKEGENNIWPL